MIKIKRWINIYFDDATKEYKPGHRFFESEREALVARGIYEHHIITAEIEIVDTSKMVQSCGDYPITC